jgi:hypothetical protein
MNLNTEKVAHEFPLFDLSTLPPIPDGFESTAWHSETCPTWHEGSSDASPKQGDLMLAIDYPVDDDRECPGGDRFNLAMYDGQDNPIFVASSNDWAVVENAIMFARYVRHLGLGFHVDTRGNDYVNGDGSRTYTDAEAEEYDRVVYEVHGIADPYELAFTIWRTLGLIAPHEG